MRENGNRTINVSHAPTLHVDWHVNMRNFTACMLADAYACRPCASKQVSTALKLTSCRMHSFRNIIASVTGFIPAAKARYTHVCSRLQVCGPGLRHMCADISIYLQVCVPLAALAAMHAAANGAESANLPACYFEIGGRPKRYRLRRRWQCQTRFSTSLILMSSGH